MQRYKQHSPVFLTDRIKFFIIVLILYDVKQESRCFYG
jgi:hypothetical protein